MTKFDEIIITKYETEFVAKHKDFDVIGVGSNEFEAVLELSKALGALMFSKDSRHNKVTELLGLYKTEKHIAPLGVVISKSIEEEVRLNTRLKVIRFDIGQLEKELEKMK